MDISYIEIVCVCIAFVLMLSLLCEIFRMEHDNVMSEDLETNGSEELDSRTEDSQCDIPVTFKVFVQQLIESVSCSEIY